VYSGSTSVLARRSKECMSAAAATARPHWHCTHALGPINQRSISRDARYNGILVNNRDFKSAQRFRQDGGCPSSINLVLRPLLSLLRFNHRYDNSHAESLLRLRYRPLPNQVLMNHMTCSTHLILLVLGWPPRQHMPMLAIVTSLVLRANLQMQSV
jgi:hypothetical protein